VHGKAKAFFALFEFALRPAPGVAIVGFAQRALDRRYQPRPAVLEHVIDGALLQRLDGALLADGAGDEDERCFGTAQSGDLQSVDTVEARQRVVGQDHVRRERRERFRVLRLGVDAAAVDLESAQPHFTEQHFRVLHAVFDEQYFDGSGHGRQLGMRFMTAQYSPV
jgi:hypothetical protein